MQALHVVMIATLLSGCATARLSSDVKTYIGRDIHELVAHLGKPTGKLETTADRVYVWSTDSEGVLPTGAGSGSTSIMTVHHECTLEVTVNAADIIQTYQVEGSDAGCAGFLRHLRH